MKVISYLKVSQKYQDDLSKIFGCNKSNLPNKLSKYASAALKEMVTMILGQKVFNRGSDMLEYRLFLLIFHAFNEKIPDEQDVCKLFQTTLTGSRSLIRAVMSKYQYQLRLAVEKSLKDLIMGVSTSEKNDEYSISVHNLNLVEELNQELAEINTNLPPVKKKRGSVSTYTILPSSYNKLCEKYFVKPKKLK